MLILLDENLLSKKLKKPLIEAGHTVKNVEDMGWRGTKDSKLLEIASDASFEVFITADKNLPYQQNLNNFPLRIVVLNSFSTRPASLLPLIVKISHQLSSLSAGDTVVIDDTGGITSFSNSCPPD